MAKVDVPRLWATKYRLLGQVIASVAPALSEMTPAQQATLRDLLEAMA